MKTTAKKSEAKWYCGTPESMYSRAFRIVGKWFFWDRSYTKYYGGFGSCHEALCAARAHDENEE